MFSMSLFKKELREFRWKIIVGFIIFIITAVIIPLTFKYLREIILLIPEIPGFEGFEKLLQDYDIYTWSQWNGKNLYQTGTILAIIMAMNLISGEKVAKTLEFLIARPVSRAAIYFTKFAAGVISLGLVVWGSTAVLYIFSHVMGYNLSGKLLISTIITFVGLIFVFTFTLLISTVLDEPVKVGLLSALFLLLSAVPGWFKKTYFLSVFYHMKAAEYYFEGKFPFTALIIIGLFSFAFYYLGIKVFEKKEP